MNMHQLFNSCAYEEVIKFKICHCTSLEILPNIMKMSLTLLKILPLDFPNLSLYSPDIQARPV